MIMNSMIMWTFFIIFLAMPIVILVMLCRNFENLGNKHIAYRFGSIYEGLKVTKRSALIYPA